MLITIYNIYTKQSEIIKNTVENEKEKYANNIYKLDNPFYLAFYEQSIECVVADAYEFFVELDCENNFFYDNLKLMTTERGHRLFKMMSMYHTIKILRKKRNNIDPIEMKTVLFHVFEFNEKEQRIFNLLYTCACKYEGEFQGLFNKALAKYLFGKDISSPFTLAFIENFCYNSYNNFLSSFTKYISLNRRLQKMANWLDKRCFINGSGKLDRGTMGGY